MAEKIYTELVFDLGTARTDEEVEISGKYIVVYFLNGNASLKLNNPGADAINLQYIRAIKTNFNKLYITNTAQSGKYLKMIVGYTEDSEIIRGAWGNVGIWGIDSSNTWRALLTETNGALFTKIYSHNISAVASAQVTVGTTATQLTSLTAAFSMVIKADDDNTADIYIGDNSVTTTSGFRLRPGQAITTYDPNPSHIYAISTADGQTVHLFIEKTTTVSAQSGTISIAGG